MDLSFQNFRPINNVNFLSKALEKVIGYSDDHALKNTFNAKSRDDEHRCLVEMEECLKDVNNRMGKNRLQMNNGKTEFIYFGSRQMLSLCNIEEIDVQGTKIK